MKFTQKSLVPGRYAQGLDPQTKAPIFHELTAEHLAAYVDGTKALLADGFHVPVILEHEKRGSPDGAPREKRDLAAERVKHGVGWLDEVTWDRGALSHVIDVLDKDMAGKIEAKAAGHFSSYELRPEWVAGNGKIYKNVISHVALTPWPKDKTQAPLEPTAPAAEKILQFSLADLQLSDDDPDGDKPPDSNPDAPKPNANDDNQKFDALVAHLAERGLVLPSDTDKDNFIDRLLTSCMTADAIESRNKLEENDKEEKPDDSVDERPIMQYSLADLNDKKIADPRTAKLVEYSYGGLKRRLDTLVQQTAIAPTLRAAILAPATLQFSEDGDPIAKYTAADLVTMLEETAIPGRGLTVDQFSSIGLEEKPDAELLKEETTEASEEEGKKQGQAYRDAQLKQRGLQPA